MYLCVRMCVCVYIHTCTYTRSAENIIVFIWKYETKGLLNVVVYRITKIYCEF